MAEEQFLKFYTEMYGEPTDDLAQIDMQVFTGRELYDFVNEAIDYYMTEIYDGRSD